MSVTQSQWLFEKIKCLQNKKRTRNRYFPFAYPRRNHCAQKKGRGERIGHFLRKVGS